MLRSLPVTCSLLLANLFAGAAVFGIGVWLIRCHQDLRFSYAAMANLDVLNAENKRDRSHVWSLKLFTLFLGSVAVFVAVGMIANALEFLILVAARSQEPGKELKVVRVLRKGLRHFLDAYQTSERSRPLS
jgi:hypothetical protein